MEKRQKERQEVKRKLLTLRQVKTSHQALSAKRAADLSEVKAQDPTFLLRECSLCLKRGVAHLASLLVQHYLSGYKRGPPSEVCPLEYASLSDVKCII